jgi:hypothetical protein
MPSKQQLITDLALMILPELSLHEINLRINNKIIEKR